MVSSMRRSARHDTPRARSAFDTVPLPRIVPAVKRRVRAMCCDQVEEGEVHLRAGVAVADHASVVGGAHAEVDAAAAPGVAELVGRDRERARTRWPASTGRSRSPSRARSGTRLRRVHVVGEHHEPHVAARASAARVPRRNVAEDDRDLGLEVEAPGRVGQLERIARAEQIARAALVDERIALERGRRLGAARLAHEHHVVQVRRAVDPLVGARQRRGEPRRIDGRAFERAALELRRRRARSAGSAPVQSSSARWSVGHAGPAGAALTPSRRTTSRRPSRVPSRRVASFMATTLPRTRAPTSPPPRAGTRSRQP